MLDEKRRSVGRPRECDALLPALDWRQKRRRDRSSSLGKLVLPFPLSQAGSIPSETNRLTKYAAAGLLRAVQISIWQQVTGCWLKEFPLSYTSIASGNNGHEK